MPMIVRKPELDFSQSLPHWSEGEPEYSQTFNAASTVLPHLEPYLIKVLRRASESLGETDEALKSDIDLFVRQEANHYKLHQRYNETLYDKGYQGLREFELALATDYKHFLAERSLQFNLAYSEGFESLGIIHAEFMFKHAKHWLRDADHSVKTLWQWHLAEEFEHRRVCYDVYKRLYGGYFYRLYGLLFAIKHLGSYGNRVSDYLIEQDYQLGRIKREKASIWRRRKYGLIFNSYALFKVLRILSPFYNPGRYRMPKAAQALLDKVQQSA